MFVHCLDTFAASMRSSTAALTSTTEPSVIAMQQLTIDPVYPFVSSSAAAPAASPAPDEVVADISGMNAATITDVQIGKLFAHISFYLQDQSFISKAATLINDILIKTRMF